MASVKSKRTVLTLEQRIKALELLDRGKPAYKIAEEFGVGKKQIQNLRKRKSELLTDYENNVPCESKRRRYLTGNEDINDLTYNWFKDAVNRRIPITGPLLQEKALDFSKKLDKPDFKASRGWLESFIKRHNIKFGGMSGERGDVKETTVNEWKDKLPVLCAEYDEKDIFNMDESGLFFRDTTRKTFHLKGEECAGGKRSKERITVAFCASMSGEKMKPIVTGKSRAPRCFGRLDTKTLPVDYYCNKKAWMNSYIYEDFLKSFNRKMKAQKRNVLLFVDNAPSHPRISDLSNVKVHFFPPNTTSLTQPMDQGIIQTVKLKFRKRQLRHMVREMERQPTLQGSELLKKISVLDAIYWIHNSWTEVEDTTINKCFAKAGFRFSADSGGGNNECSFSSSSENVVAASDDADDDVPLAVLKMSHELFGCTFQELVKLDEDLYTCDTHIVNSDASAQNLQSEFRPSACVVEEDSDENEEVGTQSMLTNSEAADMMLRLKQIAKQIGNTELLGHLAQADDELFLFSLSFALQLQGTETTDCYSCIDVTDVAKCHSVIKCPPGYSCHATITSHKYTLGCTESKLCPVSNTTSINPGGVGSIVGRSVITSILGGCSECCSTNMCNRQLCQTNDTTCHDSGHIDCVTTGSFVDLCAEIGHAKQECKHFCGLCNMVDGSWSDWTAWSSCSVSCGNGTVTRTRSCSNPTPANGGSDCAGVRHGTQPCSTVQCPVNGGWSKWSPWGSCSVTCGTGLQRRDRTCSSPYPSDSGVHCFGDSRDDRICLATACQDGGWTNWGKWSTCSKTCDVGTQMRCRSCTNPPPSALGRFCVGNNIQVDSCTLKPCFDQEVGFTVYNPQDTGTPGRITFIHVVTNKGGGYNTTTGTFTCNLAGVYSFSLTILMNEDAFHAECGIYKNNDFLGTAHVDPTSSVGYIPASTSVYVHLISGDTVYLDGCTEASTMMTDRYYSSFTGFLIHTD